MLSKFNTFAIFEFYQPHAQRAATKVSFILFRFQMLRPRSTGFVMLVRMDHSISKSIRRGSPVWQRIAFLRLLELPNCSTIFVRMTILQGCGARTFQMISCGNVTMRSPFGSPDNLLGPGARWKAPFPKTGMVGILLTPNSKF